MIAGIQANQGQQQWPQAGQAPQPATAAPQSAGDNVPVNQPALNYLNNWYAGKPTGGLQNFMAPQSTGDSMPVNQPALNYLNNWFAGKPTGGLQNFMAPQQQVAPSPSTGAVGQSALGGFAPAAGSGAPQPRPFRGPGFGAGMSSFAGGFGGPAFGRFGGQFGASPFSQGSGQNVGQNAGSVGGPFNGSFGGPRSNGFNGYGSQGAPLGPYGFGAWPSAGGVGGSAFGLASGVAPFGGLQGTGATSPGGGSFAMRVPFSPNNGPQLMPGQGVQVPQPGAINAGDLATLAGAAALPW